MGADDQEMNIMHERFHEWPQTDDTKWFARKDGFDLPETYWKEFIEEYRPMWNFWQREFLKFDPTPKALFDEAGAPNYRADFAQPQPSVGLRIHEGAPRAMMLICPGGGFMWKACYEGTVVAERFYREGFNVAVLDYRVNPYAQDTACSDAIRAVRYLRCHAEELNTLPDHIGMMGFSAGAMLTGYCATMFDAGDPQSEDAVERCSSRPDAAVLCYGAGSSVPVSKGLLGYDRAWHAQMSHKSIERNVKAECPPFYIWQCAGMDDPRNSTQLADVLAECGVPFELHIFPYGNHGTALANEIHPNEEANDPHVAHWVMLCCEWLRLYGF